MGSSIGCSKVKAPSELTKAIEFAFQYDTKVIVEKMINAREIECAVLENLEYGEAPLVSVPGELITQHEFYDYEAKYHDDSVKLVIPANIDETLKEKLQNFASEAFETLECEGMARVDFFVDKDTNEVYINELNTIPGFTNVSMYPLMWQASGVEYSELLTTLIELAVIRYERRAKLSREC
jgi:D-alanine-D-alanine ligase